MINSYLQGTGVMTLIGKDGEVIKNPFTMQNGVLTPLPEVPGSVYLRFNSGKPRAGYLLVSEDLARMKTPAYTEATNPETGEMVWQQLAPGLIKRGAYTGQPYYYAYEKAPKRDPLRALKEQARAAAAEAEEAATAKVSAATPVEKAQAQAKADAAVSQAQAAEVAAKQTGDAGVQQVTADVLNAARAVKNATTPEQIQVAKNAAEKAGQRNFVDFLLEKYGPLPVWGWLSLGIASYFLIAQNEVRK